MEEQPKPSDATNEADEIMTVDEAAAYLRVNRKSVYDAVAHQRIPHRRLGRRIILSKQALLGWLTGGVRERTRR